LPALLPVPATPYLYFTFCSGFYHHGTDSVNVSSYRALNHNDEVPVQGLVFVLSRLFPCI